MDASAATRHLQSASTVTEEAAQGINKISSFVTQQNRQGNMVAKSGINEEKSSERVVN